MPEQMFTSATSPGEAISAVKALSKASAAGQRIYEITQANQSTVLPNIRHDAATMDEIRSALSAGRTVITHTSAVSVPGWSGAGYVLMDAETGAAAWKIGGGGNGGWLNTALGAFLFLTIFTTFGFSAGFILAIALIALTINAILMMDSLDCTATAPLLIGMTVSFALALIPIERGTPHAFLSWLIGFFTSGATSTSNAACRAIQI